MTTENSPSPVRRIELAGEYDLARRDEIAREFGSIEEEPSVVIDMAKVTYIDSSVLKELAALRSRDGSRAITLLGASAGIRRLLKVVGFDKIFHLTE